MKLELITRKPAGSAKGTPLLFVHGKWHGAWCWDEHFLPYFAHYGYHCTALSLRGHGGSEGREKLRWTSIADYVADLEQVTAQFDTPPVIISHSMGGYITQKYLEKHHEHPAAVLLAPIPPTGVWPSVFIVLRDRPLVLLKVILSLRLYPVVETKELARWSMFSKDLPDELLERYHPFLQDESFRSFLDELGINLVRSKRIDTPLLVLGGEDDTVLPPKMVSRTARTYGTQAKFFPNMAHDLMLELGWEKVAETILNSIQERGL